MRVITGTAKGIRLETLEGLDVRPTTDRVKEGMFSAIQFDVPGARVLDLFAGSGQLGIEALSRGAKQAVFVDQSQQSLDVVKRNLQKAHVADRAEIHRVDAESYLHRAHPHSFDIILLDPPYRMDILTPLLPKLVPLLTKKGIILAEHEKNCCLPKKISELQLQKEYFYGKIVVSVYRPGEGDEP
ncbi:MAG: 16S rRNA (guanine(966)-N(2))-methyltransferase RsmD [Oscillospiraceae bacterium]|nr:16S rRNA (guanine(966)-N(2))-methyltransferase RsmD [Oscillospiraceae bacterium]